VTAERSGRVNFALGHMLNSTHRKSNTTRKTKEKITMEASSNVESC